MSEDPKIATVTFRLPGRARSLARKTILARQEEERLAAASVAAFLSASPPPNPPPQPLHTLFSRLGDVRCKLDQKLPQAEALKLAEQKQHLEREIRRAEALEAGLPDPLPPPEPPRIGPKVQQVLPHQPPPGWKGFP